MVDSELALLRTVIDKYRTTEQVFRHIETSSAGQVKAVYEKYARDAIQGSEELEKVFKDVYDADGSKNNIDPQKAVHISRSVVSTCFSAYTVLLFRPEPRSFDENVIGIGAELAKLLEEWKGLLEVAQMGHKMMEAKIEEVKHPLFYEMQQLSVNREYQPVELRTSEEQIDKGLELIIDMKDLLSQFVVQMNTFLQEPNLTPDRVILINFGLHVQDAFAPLLERMVNDPALLKKATCDNFENMFKILARECVEVAKAMARVTAEKSLIVELTKMGIKIREFVNDIKAVRPVFQQKTEVEKQPVDGGLISAEVSEASLPPKKKNKRNKKRRKKKNQKGKPLGEEEGEEGDDEEEKVSTSTQGIDEESEVTWTTTTTTTSTDISESRELEANDVENQGVSALMETPEKNEEAVVDQNAASEVGNEVSETTASAETEHSTTIDDSRVDMGASLDPTNTGAKAGDVVSGEPEQPITTTKEMPATTEEGIASYDEATAEVKGESARTYPHQPLNPYPDIPQPMPVYHYMVLRPAIDPMSLDLVVISEQLSRTAAQLADLSFEASRRSPNMGSARLAINDYMHHVNHAVQAIENLRDQTWRYRQFAQGLPDMLAPVVL